MTAISALAPYDVDIPTIAAVVRAASRAPSIHNTQPWRWSLHGENLDVRGDRSRQLHVADRDGHSLLVSCGSAVELTEIALRSHGWAACATLLPDPADPNLFARFSLGRCSDPDRKAETQLAAALTRRSERRPFGPTAVSTDTIERLEQAAASAHVFAHFAVRPDESLDLAVAISRADRSERDDPGVRRGDGEVDSL